MKQIDKYIQDAESKIKMVNNIKAFNGIRGEVYVSNTAGGVTVGSDGIVDSKRFEFIKNVLNEHAYVTYIANNHDQYFEMLHSVFGERILFVDELDLVYAAKVDIFIHFDVDYKIAFLVKHHMSVLAFTVFGSHNPSIMEQTDAAFETKNAFVFDCLCGTFGNKPIGKPIDILSMIYADILSIVEIEELYGSKTTGSEQYYMYLSLAIKNKKFKERLKEINYLNYAYTNKQNAILAESNDDNMCSIANTLKF